MALSTSIPDTDLWTYPWQRSVGLFGFRPLMQGLELERVTRNRDEVRADRTYERLRPALEGFSPTPDFPVIEQARTLLNSLAS